MRSKRAKTTPPTLAQKARALREYGFKVSSAKKPTKAQKSAISKAWKKVEKFTENKKQDFVFQKATKRERDVLQRGLAKQQFTPEGFFLRKPKGARKAPRYEVKEDGTIYYHAQGVKGGRVIEEIHPIDPELLAEDPPRAIQKLLKKSERKKAKIVLTVNGFDSSTTREYGLDQLAFYIAHDLLPKFLDPNLDPAYTKAHGHTARTIEDFVDIFHIKIIKHETAKKPRRRRRRK